MDVAYGTMNTTNIILDCTERVSKVSRNMEEKDRWLHTTFLAGTELPMLPYDKFHKIITSHLGRNQSAILSEGDAYTMPFAQRRLHEEQTKDCVQGCKNFSEPWYFKIPLQGRARKPMRIRLWKGILPPILSYEMGQFLNHDPVAKSVWDWLKSSWQPEETYFASMARTRWDPDRQEVVQDEESSEMSVRHDLDMRWTHWHYMTDIGCKGPMVRFICIATAADVWKIRNFQNETTGPLIFNKFRLNTDPVAPVLHFQNLLLETFKPILEANDAISRKYLKFSIQTQLLMYAASGVDPDKVFGHDF